MEEFKNSDPSNSNHNSGMSPFAEILMIHGVHEINDLSHWALIPKRTIEVLKAGLFLAIHALLVF